MKLCSITTLWPLCFCLLHLFTVCNQVVSAGTPIPDLEEEAGVEWDLSRFNRDVIVTAGTLQVQWVIMFSTHVKSPVITWLDPGGQNLAGNLDIVYSRTKKCWSVFCRLSQIERRKMGKYLLIVMNAQNQTLGELSMNLFVQDVPYLTVIKPPPYFVTRSIKAKKGVQDYSVDFNVESYPIESVAVFSEFYECFQANDCSDLKKSVDLPHQLTLVNSYSGKVSLKMLESLPSGFIVCEVCNDFGCADQRVPHMLHDSSEPIQLKMSDDGMHTFFECQASRMFYTSISWHRKLFESKGFNVEEYHIMGLGQQEETIQQTESLTQHSYQSRLQLPDSPSQFSGFYQCRGKLKQGALPGNWTLGADLPTNATLQFKSDFNSLASPTWNSTDIPGYVQVGTGEDVTLPCSAFINSWNSRNSKNPTPKVTWYFHNTTIDRNHPKFMVTSSNDLKITKPDKMASGTYTCVVKNGQEIRLERVRLNVTSSKNDGKGQVARVVVTISVVCLILICCPVLSLICGFKMWIKNRDRKQKTMSHELEMKQILQLS